MQSLGFFSFLSSTEIPNATICFDFIFLPVVSYVQNNYINTQEHLVFWTVVTAGFKHCTRLTKLKEFILCFSCALNSKPQIVLSAIVSSWFGIICRGTYSAFPDLPQVWEIWAHGSNGLQYLVETMTQDKLKK